MTQALPQVPCCALCSIVDDPLPKEIELHPAIPTPLDQLEAVDMAFDWPVRPRQRQGGFDGRIVPLEHIHKVLQFDDIAGATGQQPRVQLIGVTLPDYRAPLLHERGPWTWIHFATSERVPVKPCSWISRHRRD